MKLIKNFFITNIKIKLLFVFLILNGLQVNVYSTENEIRPYPFKFYNSCERVSGMEEFKKCYLGYLSDEELNSVFIKDPTNRLFNEDQPLFYKKQLKIEKFEGGFYRSAPNSVLHGVFYLFTTTDSKDKNYNFSLVEDAWDCARNYYLSRVIARGPSLDKMNFLKENFKEYMRSSYQIPMCNE